MGNSMLKHQNPSNLDLEMENLFCSMPAEYKKTKNELGVPGEEH